MKKEVFKIILLFIELLIVLISGIVVAELIIFMAPNIPWLTVGILSLSLILCCVDIVLREDEGRGIQW